MGDRIPFGKHSGERVRDVSTEYLCWLRTVAKAPWLRFAVEAELNRRGVGAGDGDDQGDGWGEPWDEPPAREEPPTARKALWEPLVRRWFAQLSMRHHPDRGGSNEAMAALNAARDLLLEMLRQEGAL